MTKKLFAGLTALCCMGTLMSAFPVRAESDFNPDEASCFFIVDGTKNNSTILKWWYYGENYIYGDILQTYPKESFSYGDVLVYDGEFTILETYPGQLGGNPANLRKVGTCEDFFVLKELTVTSAEMTGIDFKFGEFQLTDAEGTAYSYSQDYTSVDYQISLEQAKIGDVYTFACYKQKALLPLAAAASVLMEAPAETLTPDGDADGSGKLDILDVITLNKAILGKGELAPDRIAYIDFNQNGVPDATDSLAMLKKIVGLL